MALADTLNTNLGGIPGQVQQKTRAGAEALAGMDTAVAERQKELSAPIQAEKEREVGAQQQVITDVGKKMAQPVQIPQETVADFSTLGGLVAVAGVMLGTSGKMSAQNVLNSMTGIMDGYKKGRADLISNYQKEFDMNQKRMQSQIQQAQTELGVILEKYKTKDQTVAQDLAVFKAKYNQGIAATIADAQSADKVASLQVQLSQINNSQTQATARIDAEREANDKKNVIVNQKTGERGYINSKTGKFVPLQLPEGFVSEGTETKAPSTVIIDGKPHQWNGKKGQWDPVTVGGKNVETLTRPGAPGKAGASGDASVAVKEYTGATLPLKDAKEVTQSARAIGEAELLQKDVEANPELIGRSGQMGRVINRYVDSFRTGKEIEDDTSVSQEQLIFAKRYAAYLVQYERGVAGGAKGFTVALQQRFNTLLNQDQFNPSGFKNLMDQHITELASQGVAYSPKNINRQKLLDFGRDIAYNSNYGAPSVNVTQNASTTPKYTTPEQIADATTRAQAALAKATTEDQKQKIRKIYKEVTGRDL